MISGDVISADVISGDGISAQPRSHAGRAGLGPTLGPRPPKYPPGQACHVTQIRLSDWSKFTILRSDWLGRILSHSSSLAKQRTRPISSHLDHKTLHVNKGFIILLSEICLRLNANEIQIPHDKHHKVSSLVKSHQNTQNSVKYEVI